METFDILLAVVAIALVALATASRDPKVKAWFTFKTIGPFALYIVYCLVGVLIVFQAVGGEPAGGIKALAGTVFVLAWIGYGVIWLIKVVPHGKEPSEVLKRPFGPLGLGFLAAAAGSIVLLFVNL